jgi:hypothetical protein
MFHELLERVRAEASGARALETIRDLTRFHRVQASPGYDAAAAWLCNRLEACGLAPEVETVPGDGRTRFLGQLMPEGWECTRAVATLIDGDRRERLCDHDEHPLSLVLRSAPARGRHRVVAIDGGAEPGDYDGVDVRDALVLSGAPVYRVHQLAVLARGAAGILADGRRLVPPVRRAEDDPDSLAYTSFWWRGDEPRGFGFVLTPRTGARLRERLRAGARLEVEVEIESRRFATTIPLVTARVPGRREGEVLVLSHLCHPRPSANDNASGVAAALETARVLMALRASGAFPDHGASVRFLWMPELTGTCAWLGRDAARARRLIAGVNLDMVGEDQTQCGSTFLIEHPPWFAASFAEELMRRIRGRALDWITSYSGAGHYSLTRVAEVPYSGGSDHVVLNDPAQGIPCPMLIQWPDRFYHSSYDTPDKSDPASLAVAVRCAATYAATLALAGERERQALLGMVSQRARVRVIEALGADDPARAVELERRRGASALASLERLGVPAATIAAAAAELEAFARREAPIPPAEVVGVPGGGRIPRRAPDTTLDFLWRMMEGHERLDAAARERLDRLARSESRDLFELAWFACDGRRDLDQVVRTVWLETGRHEPDTIAAFLDAMGVMGALRWTEAGEEAWSSSARDTATP